MDGAPVLPVSGLPDGLDVCEGDEGLEGWLGDAVGGALLGEEEGGVDDGGADDGGADDGGADDGGIEDGGVWEDCCDEQDTSIIAMTNRIKCLIRCISISLRPVTDCRR